ncbi:hypothetical protein HJA76_26990 [Rhizobium bangladeshense]|nr:hypothetical protein [Rhizobium bangladeshense]MBX4923270.1 hypothetical protein [Rhizobium bangladeshense]MBY3595220.1 hypothetical protein [Rhizobium bangladeshense]
MVAAISWLSGDTDVMRGHGILQHLARSKGLSSERRRLIADESVGGHEPSPGNNPPELSFDRRRSDGRGETGQAWPPLMEAVRHSQIPAAGDAKTKGWCGSALPLKSELRSI